jgi:hypothetical protein
MKKIHLFKFIAFLSAFLLFQLELIISKILLPTFGGTYLVWAGCVVFFQGVLLLGYLYSHLAISKWGVPKYLPYHVMLVLIPFLFFPGRPLPHAIPHASIPVVAGIVLELCRTIGPVFFVLSTMAILLQSWLSSSDIPENENPYVLYGVSNLGSFAGLLSYPFIFESMLGLKDQLSLWRALYIILAGSFILAFRLVRTVPDVVAEAVPGELSRITISGIDKIRWFLYSAAGVMLFLSVTNIITYEITPAPLFWVFPLSVYLLSYVLVFKKNSWCPAWIKDKFFVLAGLNFVFFFLSLKKSFPSIIAMIGHCSFLFAVTMFCQWQLYRGKPKLRKDLTLFYLIIAAGGFAGGVMVSWVIPVISSSLIEYMAGLACISLALIIGNRYFPIKIIDLALIIITSFSLIFFPLHFKTYNFFAIVSVVTLFCLCFYRLGKNIWSYSLMTFIILCLFPFIDSSWSTASGKIIYKHRNYYGFYRVTEGGGMRFIINGSINHGMQFLDPAKQFEAASYYSPSSLAGSILSGEGFREIKNMAVIGLGAGTLAVYCNKYQTIDFFELDQDVLDVATRYFTYLNKPSASQINVIIGDARLTLDKISGKRYDLIVVDAFSGDSIPVHLLTLEAIKEYGRHLTENGLILFHISNKYLDIAPVMQKNAEALHAITGFRFDNSVNNSEGITPSFWLAWTWSKETDKILVAHHGIQRGSFTPQTEKQFRAWTDDRTSIVPAIRIEKLLNELKEFKPFYWDSKEN